MFDCRKSRICLAMICRSSLDISKEDRQIIAKQILDFLQSNNDNVDPKKLRGLQTLIVDLSEGETEVA